MFHAQNQDMKKKSNALQCSTCVEIACSSVSKPENTGSDNSKYAMILNYGFGSILNRSTSPMMSSFAINISNNSERYISNFP